MLCGHNIEKAKDRRFSVSIDLKLETLLSVGLLFSFTEDAIKNDCEESASLKQA